MESNKLILHEDRLFSADPAVRSVTREIYYQIKDLPIYSPHGHTNPEWFAANALPEDPVDLMITPDHYIFRMLYSQGISLEKLGLSVRGGASPVKKDSRAIWRMFAENYYLFRGTPVRMWLDYIFSVVFGLAVRLNRDTADHYFDHIAASMKTSAFRPHELLKRFDIRLLATTESPLDSLNHHRKIREHNLPCKIVTTFRPDGVTDPEVPDFVANVRELGVIADLDVSDFAGYLSALAKRRVAFKEMGATATDHSAISAVTTQLTPQQAAALYKKALRGPVTAQEANSFRGMMLREMARMSTEDGLVMQIHCGSYRNHNHAIHLNYGADKGADIPVAIEYVRALKPLLDAYGNNPELTIILFTLDESTYTRELAPLVSHYPALRIGPPWWFLDSPEGMRRYRQAITETAGFYNTVGFNDDTRAFLSIPARHDMARRMDAVFLAGLVAEHRLDKDEAFDLARLLTTELVKKAYKLED